MRNSWPNRLRQMPSPARKTLSRKLLALAKESAPNGES
jgi:hypothetical protein